MNELAHKIIQVYKNHGIVGLAQKSRSTAHYHISNIKRRIAPRRETLEEQNLREEYGLLSNPVFQITSETIAASRKACEGPTPDIKTATWIVPYFNHFAFGGIQTIFRFIERLSQEGVENNIVIYDHPTLDIVAMRRQISEYFPKLANYKITVFADDKIRAISKLPPTDVAFCTLWVSAYLLLHFNKTKRKYYFIQDYEPFFYVAGSTSALAESTYRFGFRAIVNTPGLLAAVNQRHGQEGISFIPAVNEKLYYPNPQRKNKRTRIFFYARPMNPRNAFVLGILTIKQLLARYGTSVEIITAGAEWSEEEYGLKGKIINKGLIGSIEEVASLYRSCDIGFSFMLNKHPSYQVLEYAASGVAAVINYNEDHQWLYKDNINCLLAEPSPADMAEKIGRLVESAALRRKLVKNAAEQFLGYTWDQQTDMIWNDIKHF